MATEIKNLTRTCESCPAQWEGETSDGRQIYIRYRWGWLSVRVSEPGDRDEFAAVRGDEMFGAQLGDELDGSLSESRLQEVTEGELIFPDLKTV